MPKIKNPMTLALLVIFSFTTACSSCDDNNENNTKNNPKGDMSKMDMSDMTSDQTTDMPKVDMPDMDVKDMTPQGKVVTCPQALQPASSGLCDVTAGNNTALVLKGTVLSGDTVYEHGTVVVDRSGENGQIVCVGCDCDANATAQGATTLTCANAVISPGLINAHDHITFNSKGEPKGHGDERFDHRHDWRIGKRGHKKVSSNGSSSKSEAVLFAELRHLIGGATSIAGSGGADGFLRNLDRSANGNLPGNITVDYSTFPLGDTRGTLAAEGCDSYNIESESALENTIYLPHVAEGIDAEARNEFFCLAGASGKDYIRENTSIIHGIGLTAADIAQMANDGAKLVWSPRSNIDLYGQTAEVITYDKQGVTIGIGTDWIISGSMNMLRELQCADYLNTTHYNKHFSDLQLWQMATSNNAVALGVQDYLGSIERGKIADIAIFDGTTNKSYRAVLDAGVEDVALVLRGGQPLYGNKPLISALLSAEDAGNCEDLDVCTQNKSLCAKLDTGSDLATLRSEAGEINYELFFCETPTNEPSCVPTRPDEYTGITDADKDGDGVPDSEDICPTIFNPKRPLDNNGQPNQDGDAFGDVCDLCLFNEGMPCEPYDPNDFDGDGVPTAMDNCPYKSNMDQSDRDQDKIGDVCDACPDDANPDGAGCPATIYAIKKGEVALESRIALKDVVVSGSGDDGFFVQVPADRPNYPGIDHSGIFVFASSLDPKPAAGDRINLNATTSEYQNQVQLSDVSAADITVVSQGQPPMPVTVTEAEIVSTGAKGKVLEGVLVRVENVQVKSVDYNDRFNQFTLNGNLVVDDILFKADEPAVGDAYTAIIGPISFRFGENHLAPRSASDLVQGPAEFKDLSPATSYIQAGTTGPTTPSLVVRLTSTAQQDTSVNLTYSDASVLTGPASVTVPMGQSEIALNLQAVTASATPQVVTATDGATTQTANVIVYDDATARTVTSLTSSTMAMSINQTATLTVTLNLPAATGGTTVNLSNTNNLITAPATLNIPAGQLSADVTVNSGANTGSETLTAKVGQGAGQSVTISVSALPANCLIFSEYGESGSIKLLELYNCGSSDVDLSEVSLCLVSNNNTSCSNTTKLSGTLTSGSVRVLCNSQATEAVCQDKLSTVNFNGDDRIAIYKDDNNNNSMDANEVLDSFGQATVPPGARLWEDAVFRRCNLTPFDGSMAFDVTAYYTTVGLMGGNLDLSQFGMAPTMMSCP